MSRPEEYLSIPEEYGQCLGLRWSAENDALEHTAEDPSLGLTFVMAGEIAAFLEGFHAVRSSINFAHVLHLLKLISTGDVPYTSEYDIQRGCLLPVLASLYRELGRPLRNAGFLCGHLCRDVPRVPDPPDLADLGMALQGRFSSDPPRLFVPSEPSLEPKEFEVRVLKALQRLDSGSLEHWLRHGRGPIGDAGEKVADEAEAARPRTLIERLEALGERPRLAVSAGLVAHLDGALVLPSRRLAPAALPVGGYSDVTTRGQPEQILPAQFALDDLEFLRRFASRELLYFHREEPQSTVEEELVLVMDQGVRTWGDVRLVLSAAGMALARRSARRGVRLLLASTGNGGGPRPVEDLNDEALAARFEGSDLTSSPAFALDRVLTTPADRQRDVVLLTHPRALKNDDVCYASAQVDQATRLFAVAVDAAGEVTLAELRRGVAVPLARCRVTIPPVEPREPVSGSGARTPWRGDVEPAGFPFRLGALDPIEELFAFEHGCRWLVAVSPRLGLLYTWRIDDATMEILPRPTWNGLPLSGCRAVVGVAGGFVVGSQVGNELVAAHYDLHARTCAVRRLGTVQGWGGNWIYHPDLHCVVVHDRAKQVFGLDLATSSDSPRARKATERSMLSPQDALYPGPIAVLPPGSCVANLDGNTGTIYAQGDSGNWKPFTPLMDGKPALKGGKLLQVRGAGSTLGLLVKGADGRKWVECFAAPDGRSLGAFYVRDGASSFALSSDGRLAAHRLKQGHILQVREVGSAGPPKFESRRAKFHPRLEVRLGKGCMVIRASHVHILRWCRGPFEVWSTRDPREAHREIVKLGPLEIAREPHRRAESDYLDTPRFVARARVTRPLGLQVAVDAFGHVAVLGVDVKLVAMFLVVQGDLAAWLPDATMLGPDHLIGGPPTPGANQRIAAALNKAALRAAARIAATRRGETSK
jgi:hypothetical protein